MTMGLGDSTRINTNLQALNALNELHRTNAKLGNHQLRLATGSRINAAEDDSAGYSIAKKLEAKVRGQAQALSNIGDAKSMLTVAEGSLNSVMDILQTMKEKAVQAANDSMGDEERASIKSQLEQLYIEINDTLSGVEFNGTKIFGPTDTTLNFQVGASGTEATDNFPLTIEALTAATLLGATTTTTPATATLGGGFPATFGIANATYNGSTDSTYAFQVGADGSLLYSTDGTAPSIDTGIDLDIPGPQGAAVAVTIGDLSFEIDADYEAASGHTFSITATAETTVTTSNLTVDSNTNARAAIATIDTAIQRLADRLANLGDAQNRLSFKQENLQTSMNNYEAARSRIIDADFAKEQMEIVKLQILQQTGTAALAQANVAPQAVLSLLGGQ